MTEHTHENGDNTEVESSQSTYPGTPRWVKMSGIVVALLVLAIVIILVAGIGGEHGPGRHTPSGSLPTRLM